MSTHHFTEPDCTESDSTEPICSKSDCTKSICTAFTFAEINYCQSLFFSNQLLKLPPNLAVEIRAQDGDVVLGQTAQQLVIKIVGTRGCRTAVALLKRAAALVDVFLQAVV